MIVEHLTAGKKWLVQENMLLFVDVTTEHTPTAVKLTLGGLRNFPMEYAGIVQEIAEIKLSVFPLQ